jgi:hypothetical protein
VALSIVAPAATAGAQAKSGVGRVLPAKEVSDARFQDQLSAKLAELTGVSLF